VWYYRALHYVLQTNNGERIREHFPEGNIPDDRPGRKQVPARHVLEGVLWILNRSPVAHASTVLPQLQDRSSRFQQWCRNDVLRDALCQLANALRESGAMDESERYIDATFSPAKGRGKGIGLTKRGKGVKIMGIVDRNGLPPAVTTHAANHHEVTLVQLASICILLKQS
jgi:hypothetical protein